MRSIRAPICSFFWLSIWNDWISSGFRAAETPGSPTLARARTGLDEVIAPDEIHYFEQSMRQLFRFASKGQSRSSRPLAER